MKVLVLKILPWIPVIGTLSVIAYLFLFSMGKVEANEDIFGLVDGGTFTYWGSLFTQAIGISILFYVL